MVDFFGEVFIDLIIILLFKGVGLYIVGVILSIVYN